MILITGKILKIGKMKVETSPVLVSDSFTALLSKSYTFSYNNIQKAKEKGIQKTPTCEDCKNSLFMTDTITQQGIQFVQTHLNLQLKNKTKQTSFKSF